MLIHGNPITAGAPMAVSDAEIAGADDLVPVTPADGTDLPGGECRGVVIGAAGALAVTMASGEDRTIPSGLLAVGIIHPLHMTRIKATGTTATPVWVAY